MVEILGCDLKRFFDTVDNPPKDAEITYAGNSSGINYEVWEVSDEYLKLCAVYLKMNLHHWQEKMHGGVVPKVVYLDILIRNLL